MTLTLLHRWEHALIAETVDASSKKCPTCYLGRTAIQKLIYFIGVLGVPMKYRFEIHNYGPFCPNVMHDVEWLLADDVIEDRSQEDRYSNYKPSVGWPELSERFKDKLNEYEPLIEAVCDALSDLSPDTLELIATLDFSYRWIRARGLPGPWKSSAIEKFKEIKNDKFSDKEIESWYQVLVNARLIEK
jgi:uncharacterized protein YwgA